MRQPARERLPGGPVRLPRRTHARSKTWRTTRLRTSRYGAPEAAVRSTESREQQRPLDRVPGVDAHPVAVEQLLVEPEERRRPPAAGPLRPPAPLRVAQVRVLGPALVQEPPRHGLVDVGIAPLSGEIRAEPLRHVGVPRGPREDRVEQRVGVGHEPSRPARKPRTSARVKSSSRMRKPW